MIHKLEILEGATVLYTISGNIIGGVSTLPELIEISTTPKAPDLGRELGMVITGATGDPILATEVEQMKTRTGNYHVLAKAPVILQVLGSIRDAGTGETVSINMFGVLAMEGATSYGLAGRGQTLRVYRANFVSDRGSL